MTHWKTNWRTFADGWRARQLMAKASRLAAEGEAMKRIAEDFVGQADDRMQQSRACAKEARQIAPWLFGNLEGQNNV